MSSGDSQDDSDGSDSPMDLQQEDIFDQDEVTLDVDDDVEASNGYEAKLAHNSEAFVEQFALASESEREAMLGQILPGSEDYYFFNIIHRLNKATTLQKDSKEYSETRNKLKGDVNELLASFKKLHPRHKKLPILERRAKLVFFLDNSATSSDEPWEWLSKEHKIKFAHQQAFVQQATLADATATSLDLAQCSWEVRRDAALADQTGSFGCKFTSLGHYRLIEDAAVPSDKKEEILSRLTLPSVKGLPQLIAETINRKKQPVKFGSLTVHQKLTLEQLEELMKLVPSIIDDEKFVSMFINRLIPDLRSLENSQIEAVLRKVHSFVKRLAPVFNSYRAAVLLQFLRLGLETGAFDDELLIEYLQTPRKSKRTNQSYIKQQEKQDKRGIVYNLYSLPGFPDVYDKEEKILEAHLSHHFVKAKSIKPYALYLDETYLQKLFAEVKLLHGEGSPEDYLRTLKTTKGKRALEEGDGYAPYGKKTKKEPSYGYGKGAQIQSKGGYGYGTSQRQLSTKKESDDTNEIIKELKDRVELDFVPSNPKRFRPAELVELELDVKNVPTLIVKVFDLNTINYYRDKLSSVSLNINLDGLVPHEETVHNYSEPSIRRVRRKFAFPSLNDKRGVFVIDFIGNGKNSRAVIYKGELTYVQKVTVAGHALTIFDENLQPLKDPSVIMDRRVYKADKDGEVIIPFSTFKPSPSTTNQTIILVDDRGSFGSLAQFSHLSESYNLEVMFHLLSETFVAGRDFEVVIRPMLRCNKVIAPLSLLKSVVLSVTFVDQKGATSTKELKNVRLEDGVDFIARFATPEKTQKATFTLTAKIPLVSKAGEETLTQNKTFEFNGIEKQIRFADLFLRATKEEGYSLVALGKTGERLKRHPVEVSLRDSHFVQPQSFKLQTDTNGEVLLGFFPDSIQGLTAYLNIDGASYMNDWSFSKDVSLSLFNSYRVPFGETLQLNTKWTPLTRIYAVSPYSCSHIVKDWTDESLSYNHQEVLLTLEGLGVGTYQLSTGEEETTIVVDAGVEKLDSFLTKDEIISLEKKAHFKALKVASIQEKDNKTVEIQLRNASPSTRVHVFCSQFIPSVPGGKAFKTVVGGFDVFARSIMDNSYASGTELGSEVRYILERKYSKVFPGNTLSKPSLLLNPWAVGSTSQDHKEQDTKTGSFNASSASLQRCAPITRSSGIEKGGGDYEYGKNKQTFEFLQHSSVVLCNLRPNNAGLVTLDRSVLGVGTVLEVIALDDEERLSSLTQLLKKKEIAVRDIRLSPEKALNHQLHFSEQKHSFEVYSGEVIRINSSESLQVSLYDTLTKVFSLMSAIMKSSANDSVSLKEFEFLLSWNTYNMEQKLEKYSKFASHELHLFLSKNDKPFFNDVILPYLKNKNEKTFVDKWFLGESLKHYKEPNEFRQLNPFEMVLLVEAFPEIQQQVASYMNDILESQPPTTFTINRLFDIALRESELGGPPKDESAGEALLTEGSGLGRGGLGLGAGGARRHRKVLSNDSDDEEENESFEEEEEEEEEEGYDEEEDEEVAGASFSTSKVKRDSKYLNVRQNAVNQNLFQHVEATQKLVESNYYKINSRSVYFTSNAFWLDFVRRDRSKKGGFISKNIIYAAFNRTEVLLALSLLDLPLQTANNEIQHSSDEIVVKASTPLLIFRKVLKQSQVNPGSVLVSQTFFDQNDRYQYSKGERIEKSVQEEFLVQKVYGAKLVVTNVSSNTKRCSLLTQIPVGSIPVNDGVVTKSHFFDLQAYQTTTPPIEYYFYFPAAGHFETFPAHVVEDEVVTAYANTTSFNVVETRTKHDKTSWEFLSQMASEEELLEFLKKENLYSVRLDSILWRMGKSKEFWKKTIEVLSSRFHFHAGVWSYSIYHHDIETVKQFLKTTLWATENSNNWVGPFLKSDLLTTGPQMSYVEYDNILNRRAHRSGGKKHIADTSLRYQYKTFLDHLCYKSSLQKSDLLAAIYYLLLQDRVEEALNLFKRVDSSASISASNPGSGSGSGEEDVQELQLQSDYLRCYLDFFNDDPKVARTIVPKYMNYPIHRWRKMFEEVQLQLRQIDERFGSQGAKSTSSALTQKAEETALDFELEGNNIILNHSNLKSCSVLYYKMDVELLFSSSPFVQQNSGHFSYIQPNIEEMVELTPNSHRTVIQSRCTNTNVMIEVRTEEGSIRKSKPYFSHSLFVQLMEATGTIRVCSKTDGTPLPKSYVKVYAKMKNSSSSSSSSPSAYSNNINVNNYNNQGGEGTVVFYKDGYTDLTGLFSYAQLTRELLAQVQNFSILVISEKNGTTILEAQPPSGSGSGSTTGFELQQQQQQQQQSSFRNIPPWERQEVVQQQKM